MERAAARIAQSGLPYQLTPMGTIIEGEWEAVMAVVGACFAAMRTDCDRIGAVEAKAGRKLAT